MCICLPGIIHIFSPCVKSEITADGLLGYIIQAISAVGTILLACVTVWQNQKLQEEGQISQDRMEQIAIEANKINFTAKIIEHEEINYTNLRNALDGFSEACNLQGMINTLKKLEDSNVAISPETAKLMQKIDDSFFVLCRELRMKPDLLKEDKAPLNNRLVEYYLFVKKFFENYYDLSTQELSTCLKEFEIIRENFYEERENYLIEQENKLNKLIYGNLTLEEIKKLYCFYQKRGEK